MSFEYEINKKIKGMNIKGMSAKEIAKKLGFYKKFEAKEVAKVLKNMARANDIEVTKSGKYFSISEKSNVRLKGSEVKKEHIPKNSKLYKGTLRGNKRGFAFLIREDGGEDLFIPHRALNGAMHGDIVEAVITSGDEGKVVNILERGIKRLVGTYQKNKNFGFVVVDDMCYYSDIFIPQGNDLKAQNNTKVICNIVSYDGRRPIGKIIEVIGHKDDRESTVLSILKSYGFDNNFPREVESEAKKINAESSGDRVDYTDLLTITIDGDDSKDLDDAISLEKIGSNYKLYVHIADVSHYVKRNSILDKEALKRATSVYFPSSVYPMLPKVLSNDLCSLNEGVERLTLTCVMLIDTNGSVLDRKLEKSKIKNDYRMTYNNVTKIIEGDSKLREEYKEIVPLIENSLELRKILNKRREARGSINFETKESKITLDEFKNVEKIEPYPYTISNGIIEEFMLVANETVAEYMCDRKIPFVYRVHEYPDKEKISELRKFVKVCGFSLDNGKTEPSVLQKLLNDVENTPMENIISKVTLRSMQKAKYMSENLGHYGLAADFYCHFTSPIRRYPDLEIHRIIKDYLDNKLGNLDKLQARVTEVASISSERERAAELAERDIDDYYKTIYMERHIGDVFSGIISGVTSFGIFVELENTVEGICRIDNLPIDNYEYFEDRYLMKGTKHSYMLGERVDIEVLGVDIDNKRVNFKILEVENE